MSFQLKGMPRSVVLRALIVIPFVLIDCVALAAIIVAILDVIFKIAVFFEALEGF